MPRKGKWGVAPGAPAELRPFGVAPRLREIHEFEPAEAAIIGMRADAPGPEIPGARADYECRYCHSRVRLAPSGQRVAARGAMVVCLECSPRLEGD